MNLDILDINCPNHLGNTPLHEAVLYCNDRLIDFIHEKGGDVMAKNNLGETILHICAKNLRSKKTLLGGCRSKFKRLFKLL